MVTPAAAPRIASGRISHALASPAIPCLLTAAFIALGVMVSLKTPLYQGLDEGWHYAYVEHYALGRPLPDLNKHFTTGDVAAPYWQTHEASQPPLYYMLMGRLVALIPRGNLMEEQVLARGGVPNGMYGNFLPADEGGLGTGHVLAGRLARFATVLMGAVAVLCSYFIALWLTRRYEVAVLTMALMAFNPRNLVLSGAVSNDMAVACLAALTLLLATRVVTAERKPGLALIFLMGLSAGAALLTKYSGGAVIFAAIAALMGRMIQSRYSLRWLAINGAALAAGVLLVSGPFFVHNWQLYGDVLAWNKVNEMNTALPAPRTLQDALGWLPHILKTYFAHPAYMSPLPNRYNELMLVALLVGLAGSAWLLARRKLGLAYWPLLAAFLVNAVTYLSWFRLRDATQSMRFFSPTFIPITLLVALGWLVFIPRRWQAGFVVMVTVTYGLFTSLTLYESMGHIYAFPRYLSEGEARDLLSRPSAGRVAFENGIELLDVQLKNQRVDPGSPVELSIVWRTTAPLTVSAHLVLDARDGRGRTAASLNTANMVRYSYVPRAWQIGRPLREDYAFVPDANGEVVNVFAGWLQDGGGLVRLANSESISAEIGRVKVRGAAVSAAESITPLARLDGLADLITAKFEDDGVVLGWRATAEPLKNFTVFVHGLDAQGAVTAQHDEPFDPSSAYWSTGETFEQRIEVPGLSQARAIQVGVYDPDTGQRIRALKPDGSEWPDAVVAIK